MPDDLIQPDDDPLRQAIREFIGQVSSDGGQPESAPVGPGLPLKMLEETPLGIYLLQDGQIIYGNWWLRDFSGYSLDDLPIPVLSVIAPEDRPLVMEQMRRRLQGENALHNYPVRFLKKDGTISHAQIIARLVTYRQRPAIQGLIVDISDQVAAEANLSTCVEELQRGQRFRHLFSDLLSHHLLNKLWVMEHFLESLQETDLSREQKELTSHLEDSLTTSLAILRDTKTYLRLTEQNDLPGERIDLIRLLRGVLGELKPQLREKKMKVRLPRGRFILTGTPLLKEVFANLLSNAFKYGLPGSTVELEVEEGEQMTVRVRNLGPGIPDEHKERVFQRFERLAGESVRGVGLGLAIVKRIVELQRGRVWVEDNPEGGCVFVVELPKEQSSAAA